MAKEDRFLNTEEVAEMLQVDEQTIRRWIKSGKLKAFKPGREWKIPQSALDSLLENYSSPKAPSPARRQPDTEEPAGPADKDRHARFEGWADYIRWRASEIEREIEQRIPDRDGSQAYDGEEVYRLSSAWYREGDLYEDYRGELKPSPGDEEETIDGALSRFWQVLEAGQVRDKARGGAWDRAAADLREKQPARPGIGGEQLPCGPHEQ